MYHTLYAQNVVIIEAKSLSRKVLRFNKSDY